MSIREMPGHVPGIRPGNRPEEPKKVPLAFGLELLHIIWNHGCHELINPDTNPFPIQFRGLTIETPRTQLLPEYPQSINFRQRPLDLFFFPLSLFDSKLFHLVNNVSFSTIIPINKSFNG